MYERAGMRISQQYATYSKELRAGIELAGVDEEGNKSDLITVFEAVGKHAAGKMSDAQLLKLEQISCPTCGSCSGMFTANSMNCSPRRWGWRYPATARHWLRMPRAARCSPRPGGA